MGHKRIQFGWRLRIIAGAAFICLLFLQMSEPSAEAQTAWSEPHNLSQAGASADPQIIARADGSYHVLWHDLIDGITYSTGKGDSWSAPRTAEFPFATRRYFPDLDEDDATPIFYPLIVSGVDGLIHAFWLGDEDILFYSNVPAPRFADFDSWQEPLSLGTTASAVSAVEDENGRLHLAYFRTEDSATAPAGVYTRFRDASSESWSAPNQLYASRYLRAVTAAEANLQIIAPDTNHVFAVWDDNGQERVYFARSADRGRNWEEALAIDGRALDDRRDAVGPRGIQLGAADSRLLLSWNAGHEEDQTCTQYYTWSIDSGENWSGREPIAPLRGCLLQAQIVSSAPHQYLLGVQDETDDADSLLAGGSTLLAWDGSRWSEAQPQESLDRFTNPATNQIVNLHCHQALADGDELVVAGCDTGLGEDIWITTRILDDVSTWFPEPSIWTGPEYSFTSPTMASDLWFVANDQGSQFALWIGDNGSTIYLARQEDGVWSTSVPVLTQARGEIEQIAATTSADRLYVAWREAQMGLHFSHVAFARAMAPDDWAEPRQLSPAQPSAIMRRFLVEPDERISLAYSLPLNDDRGIYLIHSSDNGDSWSLPSQIFDGRIANWEMVGAPQLVRTGNGQQHMIWSHNILPSLQSQSPQASNLVQEIVYVRSEDGGQTWSDPELIYEGHAQNSYFLGAGERTVHHIWTEVLADIEIVWHAFSADGGLTWQRGSQLTETPAGTRIAAQVDADNRLHLLLLESGRLQHWLWDSTWRLEESINTGQLDTSELGAAIGVDNVLRAVYARLPVSLEPDGGASSQGSATEADGSAEMLSNDFYTLYRELNLEGGQPEPEATLMPTTQPTRTPAPTATPTPTPVVVLPQENAGDSESLLASVTAGRGRLTQFAIILIPTALFVLLVFLLIVRAMRRGRPRKRSL